MQKAKSAAHNGAPEEAAHWLQLASQAISTGNQLFADPYGRPAPLANAASHWTDDIVNNTNER